MTTALPTHDALAVGGLALLLALASAGGVPGRMSDAWRARSRWTGSRWARGRGVPGRGPRHLGQRALQSDGSYVARTHDLAGLPPGTYQVAITPRTFGDGETPLIEGPPSARAPPPTAIPAKYQDVATSGLTATVKAGANPAFDFPLKSP